MPGRKFLITGAAGDTGRATARLLLERGHAVRALVRRADARSAALAARGAEVVVGDLLDFRDVRRAVRGVDGVYFVYPVAAGLVQATASLAQAGVDAGVGAVVNMSQVVADPDAQSNASVNHWLAERLLDRSGLAVTHLRPTIFAEWLTYTAAHTARSGVLALPFRGRKVALIAAEDQAPVVAAILEDPGPHRGRTYPLYGPVEMTWPEIAAELSAALGHRVRYQEAPIEAFADLARAGGRDEFVVQHVSGMAVAFEAGRFSGTNDLVRTIGGRGAMTVREFVGRNAALFG